MNEKSVPKENIQPAPCQEACPAGIDVPRYIRCIKGGKFDEALAVIREKIPFPSICGYACYSPCEVHCGNRQFGEPIAIRALKRAAAEKGGELWKKDLSVAPKTGKRVAVVGSGPSGLTAAYYLTILGHNVTVFEENEQPGGMMRTGIPEYRLPREAIDKEIDYLKELGLDLQTGHRAESVDQLLKEGFNAVYIGCGAQLGAKLSVVGDELPGVMDGISFLKKVNAHREVDVGDRVAVIGGGNTAMDAARSAIRLGANDVTVIYRRSQSEMTAYEEEVGAAQYEGIKIEFLTTPSQITQKNGLLEVTFTRMKLGKPDASGRPAPVPIEGSEHQESYNTVIAAVGQMPDIPKSMGISAGEGLFIQADPETLATDKRGVYAGGDCVTGPASIIEAIAHGRKAASSIDKFFGGSGVIDQHIVPPEEEVVVMEYQAEDQSRVSLPCIPLIERISSFDAVELGLTEGRALKEAERCRSCDARQFEIYVYEEGCKECGYCIEVCGLGVFEPADSFNKKGYRPVLAKSVKKCVGCMLCFYACPDFSIEVKDAV